MPKVTIEPAEGTDEEAEHFVELMRISAPEYFPSLLGEKFKEFFEIAFMKKRQPLQPRARGLCKI
ncbi:hypothetical protein [Thermococcus peptonophilus]|uniref:hypothetical protein n=1 Tax=Thermococcus peptonophilus TaxID=53952 RepID=UPI000AC06B0F|nr:hypothetical protein [Thermococcus peptonophilus]